MPRRSPSAQRTRGKRHASLTEVVGHRSAVRFHRSIPPYSSHPTPYILRACPHFIIAYPFRNAGLRHSSVQAHAVAARSQSPHFVGFLYTRLPSWLSCIPRSCWTQLSSLLFHSLYPLMPPPSVFSADDVTLGFITR